MSFQQGLSGLNGAAKSLDVIGNNVANASTVGFKSSEVQFADVYANSLNGAEGNQAGIGSKVAAIAQEFSQGNIESSNNPLDIAINGAGFFRMSLNGTAQYTRNGQFELDKNGFLVNAQKAQLTGYVADSNGVVSTGTPQPIQINTADLKPVQTTKESIVMNLDSHSSTPTTTPFNASDPTSYNKTVPVDIYDSLGNTHTLQTYYVKTAPNTWEVYSSSDGTESGQLQGQQNALASIVQPIATAVNDPVAIATAAWGDPATTATDIQTAVDDATTALANAQALPATTPTEIDVRAQSIAGAQAALDHATAYQTAYNAAIDPAGSVVASITAALSAVGGTAANVASLAAAAIPAKPVGTIMFDSNGAINTAAMAKYPVPPTTLPLAVSVPIYPSTGATSPFTVNITMTGTTQYGGADPLNPSSTITSNTQDGYTAGHLTRFSAGLDGTILGQYSNGQSHVLAKIVLANFADPNGLTPLGNNAWAESPASGQPLVGLPNSGSLGVLQSSAVEDSNVDLTAELVNMITAQRVYQANAQTIKTQDQVLQTLVNLR